MYLHGTTLDQTRSLIEHRHSILLLVAFFLKKQFESFILTLLLLWFFFCSSVMLHLILCIKGWLRKRCWIALVLRLAECPSKRVSDQAKQNKSYFPYRDMFN